MAGAHPSGRGLVGTEVDRVATSGAQALGLDRGQVALRRPVEQDRRPLLRGVAAVDGDAVALAGADPRAGVVAGEPAPVPGGHGVLPPRTGPTARGDPDGGVGPA